MPLNNDYKLLANKDWSRGLFLSKVLKCLSKARTNSKIIPLPEVFYQLGTVLHLTKEECWYVLRLLSKEGLIEIIPFKGVRLKTRR
jgi:hypothetical protein